MDLTQRVLNRFRGRLDIIVSHPDYAGRFVVKGVTRNAKDWGWELMPPEMKVNRAVYCCRPAWDESGFAIFFFEDDITVVDAPADMVVDEMLDMLYETGSAHVAERVESGEIEEEE